MQKISKTEILKKAFVILLSTSTCYLSAQCSVDLGSDTAFCTGLSVTLDAGATYSRYNWSTGETTRSITVSTPGTYILNVSDSTPAGGNLIKNGEFLSHSASWHDCRNNVEAYATERSYGGTNGRNNVAEIDPGQNGINGDGDDMSLCQNVSGLTIGQSYTLCFDYSRRNIAPNPSDMIVSIDGGALNQNVIASNNTFGLTQLCFTFTATQSTHLLSFKAGSLLNNGSGIIVDNISIITPTPVICNASDTIVVTEVIAPQLNNVGFHAACDSIKLPQITGNNLSGDEAYYSGPGGTGTKYSQGSYITSTLTLYAYDQAKKSANCSDEVTAYFTVKTTPKLDTLTNLVFCDSIALPNITGTNLTGSEAYFSAPRGGGTKFNPGEYISNSMTIYPYDVNGICSNEDTINITINTSPVLNNPGNMTTCDSIQLPVITGSNLTGNEAYYSNFGGSGTKFMSGDYISSSMTIYIYDETGGTNNCFNEVNFDVTITLLPSITSQIDLTACDSIQLPSINGTNLTGNEAYYAASGGTGMKYNSGDYITQSITLYSYDVNGTCSNEDTVNFTITLSPNLISPGPLQGCDSIQLPSINGTNLSGNEAYYAASGGTGMKYNPGDYINSSTRLYIYDETGTPNTCFDEIIVDITINKQPKINHQIDSSACDSLGLSAITGTNLTGNEAYFSASGGIGTKYNPGQYISSSQTLYIFDVSGACISEDTISFKITPSPSLTNIGPLKGCDSLSLPIITGLDLTGNEAYYSSANGTGTSYRPGDYIKSSTKLFMYDETGTLPNCFHEIAIDITIDTPPQINPQLDLTACDGIQLPVITGTNLTGNEAYFAKPNGNGTKYNAGNTISKSTTLYAYDNNGSCENEVSFNIDIVNTPQLNLIKDTTLCLNQTLLLSPSNNDPNTSYIWQDNSTNNSYSVDISGIYFVQATLSPCAPVADTVKVLFEDCNCHAYVPNSFTPNEDSHNDIFKVEYSCDFISFNFMIYDRWGELLFQSKNPDSGWNGTYKGTTVQEGIYICKINYGDTYNENVEIITRVSLIK